MRIAATCILLLAAGAQDPNPASFEVLGTLESHHQPVAKMRVVGRTLLTLSGDSLRTWDLDKQLPIASLPDVFAFDVEPNGSIVAVGQKSAPKVIQFCEVPGLKVRRSLTQDREVGLFQFLGAQKLLLGSTIPQVIDAKSGKPAEGWREVPVGRAFAGKESVAFGTAGEVKLFSHLGQARKPIVSDGTVDLGAFDSGGKWFVGITEGRLRAWSLDDRKELFNAKDHQGVVNDVAVGGRFAATAGADMKARVYDIGAKKLVATIGHATAVQSVAFVGEGKLLITAAVDRSVKLWQPEKGEAAGDFGLPTDFECVDGSADRFYFGDQRGLVRVFVPATMKWESEWKAHTGNVTAIAVAKDRLATAGTDQAVVAWTPAGKEQFRGSIPTPDARQLRLGPDGTVYACAGTQLLAWSGPKSTVVYTDAKGSIAAFDISADGKTFGVVDRETVHLVDAATGKDRAAADKLNPTLAGQAVFGPDGRFVYRKEDGTAIVLDAAFAEITKLVTVNTSVPVALSGPFAFHPGGRLATIGGDQILVWDATEGKLAAALPAKMKLKALAFTGDGKFLAAVTSSGHAVILGLRAK